MTEPTVRDRVLRAVQEMPSDATFEDVMERILFLHKIETGRRQIAEGKGIPNEEAKRQMERWHE